VLRYGRGSVFRDIDDVPIAVDFRTHIEEALASTDVLIAIIGPNWPGPSASQSRLSSEADPVRVEIETAIRRKLPLVPVLVLGAAMPTVTQLPECLRDFAYRNAVELDAGQNFDVGMARLVSALDRIMGRSGKTGRAAPKAEAAGVSLTGRGRSRLMVGASIAAAFVLGASGLYYGWQHQRASSSTDGASIGVNPSTAAPAPPPPNAEIVFWQSIEKSITAADFEAYLRKYPDGQFALLAHNRISGLRATPRSPEPALDKNSLTVNLCIEQRDVQKDYEGTIDCLRKPAESGYAPAQHNLGLSYLFFNPAGPNAAQALYWFRKAASQSYAPSFSSIGAMYLQGRGVTKDCQQATIWLSKAVALKEAHAYLNLANMFSNGDCVEQDSQQARAWMERAADDPEVGPTARAWLAKN
jgi:TPR repeat protein